MPFAKLGSFISTCSSPSLPISSSTLDPNRYSVKIWSLLAPIYASSYSPAREFDKNPLPKKSVLNNLVQDIEPLDVSHIRKDVRLWMLVLLPFLLNSRSLGTRIYAYSTSKFSGGGENELSEVLNSSPNLTPPKIHFKSNQGTNPIHERKKNLETSAPTMSEIMDSSRAQNLDLRLETFGPFFRITAKSLKTQMELGRAEGVIRFWFGGKILHLDSIRLQRETLEMEKSIFGIGLFIGAVAIRHGYESGCKRAELLAINDTDLYHSKLVRFYTRIGFRTVYEVTGSSVGDFSHMLVWGGVGTRMDANVEELMIKWCSRFKTKTPIELPS